MSNMAQAVSNLLQEKWNLSSPSVSAITWALTKFDAAQDVPNSNFIISCYNPVSPTTSESLAVGMLLLLEDVVVDIIVGVSAGSAAAITARENMRQQVYYIVQENYNLYSTTDIWPFREKEKVESPQLMRLTILVRCRTLSPT